MSYETSWSGLMKALKDIVAGITGLSGGGGSATAAKQDTGNTSLASIDTKTPALGQALGAASTPVVLTAAQITTLTPLSTVTVIPFFTQFAAETQLTAPGNTQSLNVTTLSKIRCQYIVANINTNVIVRLEGSNDGTNWDNLDTSNLDKTITANGVYSFTTINVPLFRIRFNFVSESGGTAATIDVRFVGN